MDRYRYRIVKTGDVTFLLRDDGYRIEYSLLFDADLPAQYDGPGNWQVWSEYTTSDEHDVGQAIVGLIMEDKR